VFIVFSSNSYFKCQNKNTRNITVKGPYLNCLFAECEISNQMFSPQASACDRTCYDLQPKCSRQNVARCICPLETPILHDGR